MSTKHTPLHLETSPDGTVIKIIGADEQTITAIDWGFDIAGAANMGRLIVTAVNSHHDLVEALEATLATLNAYYGDRPESSRCESWFKARAALSKANGE